MIRQDEAKKVLSVALCDHYHHAQMALQGRSLPNYAKQNILLLGPTGVGKTYLVRSLAELIGVPFVKGDATKFTETGYVGGDVEDLVRELYRLADGDMERARFGIVYIDEIDKISRSQDQMGRDVSGRGVQTNLLRLMEETDVAVRSQQDVAGQIQAMINPGGSGDRANHINTRHILFIVSGAFEGLEEIVRKRLDDAAIGFAALPGRAPEDSGWLERAETEDLIRFGFEPEFAGRLPVRVVCQSLDEDDLLAILQTSEGSILRQYKADFEGYGIEAVFTDGALRAIAERAAREKTGARGLMTVCERILRNYKFELSGTSIGRLEVTEELIRDPEGRLRDLLRKAEDPRVREARTALEGYVESFRREHGLQLRFSAEALLQLRELAVRAEADLEPFCRERFADYQFGLRLISQNTGQKEFPIGASAVEDPEKVLSQWVVTSYREPEEEGGK